MQDVGHEDGGGAVCRADDGDGSGVLQIEEEAREEEGEEDAELRRCAEEHQPRLLEQRAEVYHRTDADEEQQGEQLVGHSGLKQSRDGADGVALRDSAR